MVASTAGRSSSTGGRRPRRRPGSGHPLGQPDRQTRLRPARRRRDDDRGRVDPRNAASWSATSRAATTWPYAPTVPPPPTPMTYGRWPAARRSSVTRLERASRSARSAVAARGPSRPGARRASGSDRAAARRAGQDEVDVKPGLRARRRRQPAMVGPSPTGGHEGVAPSAEGGARRDIRGCAACYRRTQAGAGPRASPRCRRRPRAGPEALEPDGAATAVRTAESGAERYLRHAPLSSLDHAASPVSLAAWRPA